MNPFTKTTGFAAAALAAVIAFGATGAQAQDILSASVVSANQATIVDLGSKKALGYYTKRNGKCALTVMVIENAGAAKPTLKLASTAAATAPTAARVTFAVAPGTTARIDSAQGRSVAFFCNSNARRMTVMTIGARAGTPRS